MDQNKKELLKLLDEIGDKQKEISEYRSYYQSVEKIIEEKRKGNINPEEMQDIMNEFGVLNQEFEKKTDILYEDLNEALMKGQNLAKKSETHLKIIAKAV